ncbi:hypothetical protein, partial [Streptomyces sp. NPDC126514]|uniref:hypothetical protein n=1 Tax=Streptomyces sp. NPDC126514 TaxID=3155210 RepID=UPI003332975A
TLTHTPKATGPRNADLTLTTTAENLTIPLNATGALPEVVTSAVEASAETVITVEGRYFAPRQRVTLQVGDRVERARADREGELLVHLIASAASTSGPRALQFHVDDPDAHGSARCCFTAPR